MGVLRMRERGTHAAPRSRGDAACDAKGLVVYSVGGGPRRETLRLRTCDCGQWRGHRDDERRELDRHCGGRGGARGGRPAAQGRGDQLGPAARGELEEQPERASRRGPATSRRAAAARRCATAIVGLGGDVVERVQQRGGDAEAAAVLAHARGVGDVEVGPGARAGTSSGTTGVRVTARTTGSPRCPAVTASAMCTTDWPATSRNTMRRVDPGRRSSGAHARVPRERRATTSTAGPGSSPSACTWARLLSASATTDRTAARLHSSEPVAAGGVMGPGGEVVRERSGWACSRACRSGRRRRARRCPRPCAGAW